MDGRYVRDWRLDEKESLDFLLRCLRLPSAPEIFVVVTMRRVKALSGSELCRITARMHEVFHNKIVDYGKLTFTYLHYDNLFVCFLEVYPDQISR